MDELAGEAKEAAALITSMHATLRAARQEITTVFEEMEKQKEALALSTRTESSPEGDAFSLRHTVLALGDALPNHRVHLAGQSSNN